MTAPAATPTTYRPIDLRNVAEIPQWETLDTDVRDAITVVGHVLPFRTNQYVMDHLIDWSRVPDGHCPASCLFFGRTRGIVHREDRAVRRWCQLVSVAAPRYRLSYKDIEE